MKHATQDITLLHTIICDDIRLETSGKFLLIGTYPESICLNIFPAQIPLAIWMQFKMYLTEKISFDFEIKGSALKEPINFTLEIGDERIFGKSQLIPFIAKLPFNIICEGDIDVYYKKAGDKKYKYAHSVMVMRNTTQNAEKAAHKAH